MNPIRSPVPAPEAQIEVLTAQAFAPFLAYLNDHLRDNGSPATGYFQPLPRAASSLAPERAQAFCAGLGVALREPGWRRAWTALAPSGRIVGHVDLRAHSEGHSAHRCLLGMGVDRDFRNAGLGTRLLEHAVRWARSQSFEWLDLQVISANVPAKALYTRNGFAVTGEIRDRFRIDGRSFAFTSMTLPLHNPTADSEAESFSSVPEQRLKTHPI